MGLRTLVRVAVTAGLLATAGALVAPSAPAGATPSTGFVTVLPVQLVDTRVTPGIRVQPGTELPVAVGGNAPGATRVAARVTITDAIGLGELRVHPCGAYDPLGDALLEITSAVDTGLVFTPVAGGLFCVSVTAPVHVLVVLEGYEAGTGGAAFVATPTTTVVQDTSIVGGGVRPFALTGVGGVPTGATAVSLLVSGTSSDPGFLTVYPCDQPRPLVATLTLSGSGRGWLTAAVSGLGAGEQLCVYSFGAAVFSVTLYGYWAVGATPSAQGPLQVLFETSTAPGFVAVDPTRLFDTRLAGRVFAAGEEYELDLSTDVPPSATDVVLNVTVTEPSAAGFLTVYPCESGRPLASNLNFVAAQTVPNLVTVSLGADARVCFFSNVATHALADLAGWYELGAGDGFVSVTPRRLFDTRSGARLGAGATYTLDLAGVVGADTSAVVLNVTVTEAGSAGFVTAYPCSSPRPTASNLNFVTGQTVPNLVTVAVGTDRRVCFYTSGPAHLLADLAGWYASSSDVGYVGIVPERLFDTRDDAAPLDAGEIISIPFGPGPAPGATGEAVLALVMNVTAVDPDGPGFITAYPCADGLPTVSNVNYVRGSVVPNLAIVRVDAADEVCFYSLAPTDLLADAAGYFTTLPVLTPVEVR